MTNHVSFDMQLNRVLKVVHSLRMPCHIYYDVEGKTIRMICNTPGQKPGLIKVLYTYLYCNIDISIT